jgi:RimJ/RimL family protein N-acetyltransferase
MLFSQGGKIVGIISFNRIEKHNRCATMGYWLAKSQTGRGIMTAAVKALIAEGFEDLELNRIQARVATSNDPSQAVCERAGFKKEGVLREAEMALRPLRRYNAKCRVEIRVEKVSGSLGSWQPRPFRQI